MDDWDDVRASAHERVSACASADADAAARTRTRTLGRAKCKDVFQGVRWYTVRMQPDTRLHMMIAEILNEYPVTAILKVLSIQLDMKFGNHPDWQAGLTREQLKEIFLMSSRLLMDLKSKDDSSE